MTDAIAENLAETKNRVLDAERKAGREPGSVELMVVSKTWPIHVVERVVTTGHLLLGENKVQELETKVPAMTPGLRWHLIGHLQKNKVRKVLPLVEAIHTIDSYELAERVSRIAGEIGVQPGIYLQVNIGEDDNKFGLSASDIEESDLVAKVAGLANIKLLGLMTIPPFGQSPEEARPHFVNLRNLRDRLEKAQGVRLAGLSMGMSGDFPVAIEEGATIIRVGSSIFGKRN